MPYFHPALAADFALRHNRGVIPTEEQPVPLRAVGVDGVIGAETKDAIREFQSRVLKVPKPDGRVDAGGRTLAALGAGLPSFVPNIPISDWTLKGIMPSATRGKIPLHAPYLRSGMADRMAYLRRAKFFFKI